MVVPGQEICDNEKRGLYIIFLQYGEQFGEIVRIAVVKGQDEGLVIVLYVLKIGKPYQVKAVFQQIN